MSTLKNISLTLAVVASLSTLAFAGGGYKNSATYYQLQQSSNRAAATSYYVAPAPTQSRQAFSYEPVAAFKVGDSAVLAKASDLKVGTAVLATIPQGTRITITAVQGNWLGVTIEQNGKSVSGWVASADLK